MNDKPASLPQLVALRDALLAWKDKNAAAAADNLIDILSLRASNGYAACPQCKTGYDERFTHCLRCNSELTRPSGCLPTYDELINGAKFTDEHKARLRVWWSEHYSNEAMNSG